MESNDSDGDEIENLIKVIESREKKIVTTLDDVLSDHSIDLNESQIDLSEEKKNIIKEKELIKEVVKLKKNTMDFRNSEEVDILSSTTVPKPKVEQEKEEEEEEEESVDDNFFEEISTEKSMHEDDEDTLENKQEEYQMKISEIKPESKDIVVIQSNEEENNLKEEETSKDDEDSEEEKEEENKKDESFFTAAILSTYTFETKDEDLMQNTKEETYNQFSQLVTTNIEIQQQNKFSEILLMKKINKLQSFNFAKYAPFTGNVEEEVKLIIGELNGANGITKSYIKDENDETEFNEEKNVEEEEKEEENVEQTKENTKENIEIAEEEIKVKEKKGQTIIKKSYSTKSLPKIEKEREMYLNNVALSEKAWFFWKDTNPVRLFLFRVLFSRICSFFFYFLALLNLILYFIVPEESFWIVNIIFISIYTIEVALKIIVLGLFNKHSYLKNSVLNIINLLMVIGGWSCLIFGLRDFFFSVFKTNILIEFLIQEVPFLSELNAINKSILKSLSMLRDVFAFLFFFIILFGLTGMEFFMNSYQRVCVMDNEEMEMPMEYMACGKSTFWGNECPDNMKCLMEGGNINNGMTSFDNFIDVFVTIFQTTTLVGWSDLEYPLMDSEISAVVPLWFVVVICVMTFVIVNLFMAIFASIFGDVKGDESNMQIKK